MAIFIYKLLSFAAAKSHQFTSYLMFSEDYIQRWMFLSSRGFSRASLILFLFSVLSALASLYGTLLWALDAPGYIFRGSYATIADYQHMRNPEPPYMIQLRLDASTLDDSEKALAQTVALDLFKPGLNYTLTGQVDIGSPNVTKPTRQDQTGARIWLDDEGFSVSTDSLTAYPETATIDGQAFPTSCIRFGADTSYWNCTFNNTFSQDFAQTIVGRPEIHWDDESDLKLDSRYIRPNRVDNIWASYGAGGGSALMMQVFTLTKGTRRHTFMQSTLRLTMLTNPGIQFVEDDVSDFVKRSWSSNQTERSSPVINDITKGMVAAQNNNVSYHFGASNLGNGNNTVLESSWSYLAVVNRNSGAHLYSLIAVAATNITLIRSETIGKAPTSFDACDNGSWQNEAFGGKVTQTDCAASVEKDDNSHFFGQVDTAAVMIVYGLGDGRSNISSESLDEGVMAWLGKNLDRMADLLIARAYTVSVDPALVTIRVNKLTVAMSKLQLILSALAVFLAGVAWLGLAFGSQAYWSNTLLANLVHSTSEKNDGQPGYMHYPPEVGMVKEAQKTLMVISGNAVALRHRDGGGVDVSDQVYQNYSDPKQGYGLGTHQVAQEVGLAER